MKTIRWWCSLLGREGGRAKLCTSVLQTLASHMPPDSYQAATKSTAAGAGLRGRRWQAYVGCGQAMKTTSHLATLAKQAWGHAGLQSNLQSPASQILSHFRHWRTDDLHLPHSTHGWPTRFNPTGKLLNLDLAFFLPNYVRNILRTLSKLPHHANPMQILLN